MPIVSILIPVYNRKVLISDCIQSALSQTFTNFEIVVVDNASEDGTWEVCRNFARRDTRVRVFRNEENIGPVRNWMRCAEEARGDYVKILFSDDLIAPDFLERSLPFMFHDVGFVFTKTIVGHSFGTGIGFHTFTKKSGKHESGSFIKEELLGLDAPVSPGCALFRREDVIKYLSVQIQSSFLSDFHLHGAGPDVLLFLFAAKNYPYFYYIDNPLTFFREHANSITTSRWSYIQQSYRQTKIWFAEKHMIEYLGSVLVYNWLKECYELKEIMSFSSFRNKYTNSLNQFSCFEKLAGVKYFFNNTIKKVLKRL